LARLRGEFLLIIKELNLVGGEGDLENFLSPEAERSGENGGGAENAEDLLHGFGL
jgi:hypothetical protein